MAKRDDEWFVNIRSMEDLESEMRERRIETNKAMAFALLEGLRAIDEDDELWELVEEMMKQDSGLVSKLELTIANVFIENGLATREGERHAH
jgi:hypothetical protein